jgi:hypothetical protein
MTFSKTTTLINSKKTPQKKYQKLTSTNMKQCQQIFPKNETKYLTQKKPQPPLLKAHIKKHKPGNTTRPVVNNRIAPTYKATKLLAKKRNDYTHLAYQYNVINPTTLATDLTKLTLNDNHRMTTTE